MAEGEYGKFDFSGVHVDMNKNKTEFDVAATFLHELTHQMLASSSSIGALDYLLMNILNVEENAKIVKKIKSLYERISKSSIKVQESTAVLSELLMLKSMDERSYMNTLKMYENGRIYMKEYGFENLKFFLSATSSGNQEEDKLKTIINIRDIAIKSMNIDLQKINPLDGKNLKCLDSNLKEYNANYRFKNIIKNIKTCKIFEMKAEEIDDIFTTNRLPLCAAFKWDEFSKWANNKICKPLGLKDANEYVNYVTGIDSEELLCSISAYNSNNAFKLIIPKESELKKSWNPDDILYIQFEEAYYRYVLTNVKKETQVLFLHKDALIDLAKNVKMLFMDRNHYKLNISTCPQFADFDTFVDIGNWDSYALDFIKGENIIEYYIKKLNENFCIIFFRGKLNTTFFWMCPQMSLVFLNDRILRNLSFQGSWWEDFIPEEKMEHMCEYVKKVK